MRPMLSVLEDLVLRFRVDPLVDGSWELSMGVVVPLGSSLGWVSRGFLVSKTSFMLKV